MRSFSRKSELLPSSYAAIGRIFFKEYGMHRTYYFPKLLDTLTHKHHQYIAYHEAGHVAAIYLRNREQNLPPVFFEVIFNPQPSETDSFFAKVEGGRLIENLPVVELENACLGRGVEKQNLQQAYEADVINLLAGPLAEAKFVAHCDDEVFNPQLINVSALRNYGGYADLESAYRYLEYFISDERERELKLATLFLQAYQFIDQTSHWQCIQHFAHYILSNEQKNISCEQVSQVFDSLLATREPLLTPSFITNNSNGVR